jgi:hypothetical protein
MSSFLVTNIYDGEPVTSFIQKIFSSGKHLVSHAKYANKKMQAGFNLTSETVAHLNHSFNVSTYFRKPPMSWRKHSKKITI